MTEQQINPFGSKASDHWATPKWLFQVLNAAFQFTLDPCPFKATTDGLEVPWHGSVFCNPPYSCVGEWFQKAETEWESGRLLSIVFLVFANTDTEWFHRYVYGKYEVVPIEGRLRFNDGKNSAMRPSILCIRRK